MKAENLAMFRKEEGILCQEEIGMAPHEACANAFPSCVPQDLAEFYHLRARRKNCGLQSESLNALEQFLLSKAKPLVFTGINPLKCDAEFHCVAGSAFCAVFALSVLQPGSSRRRTQDSTCLKPPEKPFCGSRRQRSGVNPHELGSGASKDLVALFGVPNGQPMPICRNLQGDNRNLRQNALAGDPNPSIFPRKACDRNGAEAESCSTRDEGICEPPRNPHQSRSNGEQPCKRAKVARVRRRYKPEQGKAKERNNQDDVSAAEP